MSSSGVIWPDRLLDLKKKQSWLEERQLLLVARMLLDKAYTGDSCTAQITHTHSQPQSGEASPARSPTNPAAAQPTNHSGGRTAVTSSSRPPPSYSNTGDTFSSALNSVLSLAIAFISLMNCHDLGRCFSLSLQISKSRPSETRSAHWASASGILLIENPLHDDFVTWLLFVVVSKRHTQIKNQFGCFFSLLKAFHTTW